MSRHERRKNDEMNCCFSADPLSAAGPARLQQSGVAFSEDTATWQEQHNLGVRYLSQGNDKEAILAFTDIEIVPKRAEAFVGRSAA